MLKSFLIILFLSLLLPNFISSQSVQYNICPMAYCDDYLGEDVCFMHSGTNPVTYLRFSSCQDSSKVCYMGEDYAWLDAPKQFYSSGMKT